MRLYGAILLALCFVTAGCGDEDASVENPLAPTAVVEAVAQVPGCGAEHDGTERDGAKCVDAGPGKFTEPSVRGARGLACHWLHLQQCRAVFQPGKHQVGNRRNPPAQRQLWQVRLVGYSRQLRENQHRARLHAQANLVFPCGRLKQNKTLYREAGCVSREPRLSDVFFPDDFAHQDHHGRGGDVPDAVELR